MVSQSERYGWKNTVEGHDWATMRTQINNYIRSLNFGYKNELKSKKVDYLNAKGRFKDPHTIEAVDKKGKTTDITADKVIIAVGGRPTALDCPGSEHAIDSDDLFWLEKSPGLCSWDRCGVIVSCWQARRVWLGPLTLPLSVLVS